MVLWMMSLYTTPKKRKQVKLAVLKYLNVDESDISPFVRVLLINVAENDVIPFVRVLLINVVLELFLPVI